MYKLELKFDLPLMLMSFPVVVMLILFVAGGYEFYQELTSMNLNKNVQVDTDEKMFKVDLQSTVALNNMDNNIEGLGVDNAEMYILKLERKKTGLSSLLSKLKTQKNNKLFKVTNKNNVETNNKILPNYNAFLSREEKVAMNEKMIKDLITSKKHLFKDCYNKMLLKDELLSGYATITISSLGRGHSIFKGVGRTKVVNELKNCLNSQVTKIDLSKIKITKVIRFSLNFSS